MSVNPSARSSCSATYCGAVQMPGFKSRTEVVSRAPGAAATRGEPTKPAAPAIATFVIKRRRVCVVAIGNAPVLLRLRLQLAFEFVEETPIRAVNDDFLRARVNEARLMKPQRIIADRVLGIVFAPFVVRNLV